MSQYIFDHKPEDREYQRRELGAGAGSMLRWLEKKPRKADRTGCGCR